MPPITLSRVDLPEPLWPMRPSVLPASSSNEMSCRAQNSSACFFERPALTMRSLRFLSLWMLNFLETSWTRMIGVAIGSELLGEVALRPREHPLGGPQQDQAHPEQHAEALERTASGNRVTS